MQKYYIVKHKDDTIREFSRSGGVFTAISDIILERQGVVYGCILNENFKAVHARATSKIERDAMRGSKYIQSDMGDIFLTMKQDALTGKEILFSGTTCQASAVKKYAETVGIDDILLVDLVCHGVPSTLIWEEYLKFIETKKGGKVSAVNFRNKRKYGWGSHVETVEVEGKGYDSTIFSNLFRSLNILRESCFKCPYKNIYHPTDITIADAWGIHKKDSDFDDDRGVSLVWANSKRGIELLEKVLDKCVYREVNIDNYLQDSLIKPVKRPVDYDRFWKEYQNKGARNIFAKIEREIHIQKVIIGLKNIIKKIVFFKQWMGR